MIEQLDVRNYPGYFGSFTRQQAAGAIPNGAEIRKVDEEKGDATPIGTTGKVLGSLDVEKIDPSMVVRYGGRFMYFVEWSDKPGVAVAVIDWKIARDI